jgi:CheY-like chemotaxis protein
LELLRFILSDEGAIVTAFSSAIEALQAIPSALPDILISDISMPDMSGHELVQRIRALPVHQGGNIPAIAITAYAQLWNQEEAIASGFQTSIAKPFDLAEVIETVTQITAASL